MEGSCPPWSRGNQPRHTQGRADDGAWIFSIGLQGSSFVYHDGDQGGFSSEMLIDPAEHTASILAVNTTDPERQRLPPHCTRNRTPSLTLARTCASHYGRSCWITYFPHTPGREVIPHQHGDVGPLRVRTDRPRLNHPAHRPRRCAPSHLSSSGPVRRYSRLAHRR